MKTQWYLPAAALVVGVLSGYLAGRGSRSGVEKEGTGDEVGVRQRHSSLREDGGRDGAAGRSRQARAKKDTGDLASMAGFSARTEALMKFYEGLAPGRFEEEAGKLESLPINERIMASILLFGRWGETDPVAAMAFADSMGFAGMFAKPTVLQSWASVDPVGAARHLEENQRDFAMMGMMGGMGRRGSGGSPASIIAREWARQNPDEALKWAGGLANGKTEAIASVVSEIARKDPEKAGSLAGAAQVEDKSSLYRSVAGEYGAKDFQAAKSWIDGLPAEVRSEALAAAIGGLSNKDPRAAMAEWERLPAGDARDDVAVEVIEDLAKTDPVAAGEFLKRQSGEEARIDAARQLMPAWTAKDPVAALSFANSLPQGAERDGALQSYVWTNSSAPSAEVVKAAETINDEGTRNRSVGIVVMRWMREDDAAAKAYLDQSSVISDDMKQRIRDGRGIWGGRGRRGGP
jgi:hypothetical protein